MITTVRSFSLLLREEVLIRRQLPFFGIKIFPVFRLNDDPEYPFGIPNFLEKVNRPQTRKPHEFLPLPPE